MKLTAIDSDRLYTVPIKKYLVDWNKKRASLFQFAVKQYLKPYWYRDICLEEFRIPRSLLRIDLINLNKKIVVEASGTQHENFNSFFHKKSRLQWLQSIQRDAAKYQWCIKNGFQFVEIYEKDLPLNRKFFKDKFNIDLV